jgi:hypothetical protein
VAVQAAAGAHETVMQLLEVVAKADSHSDIPVAAHAMF